MDNYIIKNSPNKGNGLFSTIDIVANHTIFEFVGNILLRENIPDFTGKIASCLLQIGSNKYLDLVGNTSYFTNHSCLPNSFVKIILNKAFLVSIRDIKKGEELTFDYSLTSTEDPSTWSMQCNCSMFKCRKLITGFYSLPKEQQSKLIIVGMVPSYAIP